MVLQPQVLALAGLLMLLAGVVIPLLVQHAHRRHSLFPRAHRRIRIGQRPLRMIRRCLMLKEPSPGFRMLQRMALPLQESILLVRQELRRLPALPAEGKSPRLMALARQIADEAMPTPDALRDALRGADADSLSSAERFALPLAVSVAQIERLLLSLKVLAEDDQSHRKAARLAARLSRAKRPVALLTEHAPSLGETAALLTLLQQKEQPFLLEAVNEWLGDLHTDAADVAARYTQRQLTIADTIQEVCASLQTLRMMNWQSAAEESDPLHRMLLDDPSGLYPQMTAASRADLRSRAAWLARCFHTLPGKIVSSALFLCREAEPRALERYVGFYLSEPEGMQSLRKHLGTRHGLLTVLAAKHRTLCIRLLLWAFSIAVAFPFLHADHPLGMLPFFLILLGSLPRALLRRFAPEAHPPALSFQQLTPELRTLVVLPAELCSPEKALRMLHRLSTARHAIRAEGADFLLLGDHAERIAQFSSGDAAVHAAVREGISALSQEQAPGRVLYLHRARAWSEERRAFLPRGGRFGAIETLCHLIAQGECGDMLDCATFSPDSLYRRYAFVLALDEESPLTPGMLQALLSAAAHPSSTRIPVPDGTRGFSCFRPAANEEAAAFGIRLLRPDAYLESVDGLLSDHEPGDMAFLTDALSGCLSVPLLPSHSAGRSSDHSMAHAFGRSFSCWQMVRWLLPWVNTPSGAVRNPLPSMAQLRLRERLRASTLPLCQCILLLYSLLRQDVPLMLSALFVPAIASLLSPDVPSLCEIMRSFLLLPSCAAIRSLAAFRAILSLFRSDDTLHEAPQNEKLLTAWCQGIACAFCLLFGLVLSPFWLPSLLPAALFAAFPLLPREKEASGIPQRTLPADDVPLLSMIAAATWRYFQDTAARFPASVPADLLQFAPHSDVPPTISPEGIAMYILASVSARELALISPDEAGGRIGHALDALARLPMPLGLPCRQYAIDCREILDSSVDTRACALLLAALMTSAQALRTWLPQLSPSFYDLPARLDAQADALDIRRLYDPESALFFGGLDRDGSGIGHLTYYCDEGLLLSLAGCVRGIVPPQHFARLSHTHVQAGGNALPLSQHGDLTAYLLPGLFLPIDLSGADRVVHLQQLHGIRALWGRSASADHAFTPELQYRQRIHGLQEIAASETHSAPVFAPYAAALALLCVPEAAAGCLRAMQQLGAFGLHGFCDAIDLSREGHIALVQMHSTVHQGAILCACAHALANKPLQRYFCAIPAVEAHLPLLMRPGSHATLPAQPLIRPTSPDAAPPEYIVEELHTPSEACLLGNAAASIHVSAAGSSRICIGGLPVTRYSGMAPMLDGIQLYLIDEEQSYRLTDPSLPGQTVFSRGAVRFQRTCGSLRTALTVFVDPCERRILHLLEISNLATIDRWIEAADCMLPDLNAAPDTLEAALPQPQHLVLHDRASGACVHHRFCCSAAIDAASAVTDALAFLGAGCSLRRPASLEEPLADLPALDAASCLAFRFRFKIGGRGQVRCLFSTSLTDVALPAWEELPGLMELSTLHEEAVARAAGMRPETEALLPAITGALFSPLHPAGMSAAVTLPQASSIQLLTDLLAVQTCLGMKGYPLHLHAVCTDDTLPLAEEAIRHGQEEVRARVHLLHNPTSDMLDTLWAAVQLVVRGDGGELSEQFSAMKRPLSKPQPVLLPPPGNLPEQALLNPGSCGGFDPDSGDYLIRLEAQQTPPLCWPIRHAGGSAAFHATPFGLAAPFDERLTLRSMDGLCFDPLSSALPRQIRIGGSVVQWQSFAENFTISLKTSLIPGRSAALRSLRIRDLSGQGARFTLSVSAALAHSAHQQLTFLPDAAIAEGGPGLSYAAAASDGFSASLLPMETLEESPSQAESAALLTVEMEVPANGSSAAAWIVGFAPDAETIADVQLYARSHGSSAIFRRTMELQAEALPPITIKTPEPALDLLMNHVLPRQLLCARKRTVIHLPILLLISPALAVQYLTSCASDAATPADVLTAALMAGVLLQACGADALQQTQLPDGSRTLADFCIEPLLAASEDSEHSPFLAAAAAGLLAPLDARLDDLRRDLLNRGDIRLWQGDHYGEDERLQLPVQSWAALAYGDTPRTQRALRTCWDTLYEREHGLIRHELPREDAPICPGLPGNGGQETIAAVWYLAALMHLGQADRAWELLRALNPLHRCDSPLRAETYAGAPWFLADGMQATPAAAGRTSDTPDDTAASWLYTIVIGQLLGIAKTPEGAALNPHVPPEWDEFSISMRIGAATWHLSFERGLEMMTIDGLSAAKPCVALNDDSRIHQVRIPLT